jgi:flagellar P-ring protein precursor FlgI
MMASLVSGGPFANAVQTQAPLPDPATVQAPVPNGLPASGPAVPSHVPSAELRVQIRDITTVEGHRGNYLMGMGIVVGLNGTGGKSEATRRSAENLLKRFDINQAAVNPKSMSLVAVTAELPPFFRPGDKLRVVVSVADEATDLKGGTLLLTPLKGTDDQVYALAEGPLLNSGFSVKGDSGSVQKNHPTTASATATVEKTICPDLAGCCAHGVINLLLVNKEYETAARIAAAINMAFPDHASALDGGTVAVRVPPHLAHSLTDFIAMIGSLTIVPSIPARVVINQKTGTIVIGSRVRISRVVFANDNLIITTSETPAVSQPAPFSNGETTVVPRTRITAVEEGGRYNLLSEGIEVGEFAAALNAMGVSPQDLITIFQTIESSGALHARLEIE